MKIDDVTNIAGMMGSSGGSDAAGASSKAPKEEFLRLLVAQLEHQNPLDPQDGADFVAQLAQFSSLEQAAQTNEQLEAIQVEQASAANASLAGFVGHEATTSADIITLDHDAGPMPELTVKLDGATESGEVVIRDANGNEVERLPLGASSGGEVTIPWDGTDAQGMPVSDGQYQIQVEATAPDGSSVDARPHLRGVVGALEFENGQPRLRLGAASITPGDVLSIR